MKFYAVIDQVIELLRSRGRVSYRALKKLFLRESLNQPLILQQLSVIGRQFPVSLIKQVVSQSEAELYRVLSSLQGKEFLYERPAFPEVEYIFNHALTQEVAYGMIAQIREGLATWQATGTEIWRPY